MSVSLEEPAVREHDSTLSSDSLVLFSGPLLAPQHIMVAEVCWYPGPVPVSSMPNPSIKQRHAMKSLVMVSEVFPRVLRLLLPQLSR